MKLYLEIDIRPYLRMWKSNDNGTSNKKVMKKFYELFAQPSYMQQKGRYVLLKCDNWIDYTPFCLGDAHWQKAIWVSHTVYLVLSHVKAVQPKQQVY